MQPRRFTVEEQLPEHDADAILIRMRPSEAAEIRELSLYPPDSAGGIMTPAFVAVARDATAQDVLDAVKAEAVSVRDDMAACLIAPVRHVSSSAFRTELLGLGASELHEGLAVRFLEECNVPAGAIEVARDEARGVVDEHGGGYDSC